MQYSDPCSSCNYSRVHETLGTGTLMPRELSCTKNHDMDMAMKTFRCTGFICKVCGKTHKSCDGKIGGENA